VEGAARKMLGTYLATIKPSGALTCDPTKGITVATYLKIVAKQTIAGTTTYLDTSVAALYAVC
jgi:predicted oxidoreductase